MEKSRGPSTNVGISRTKLSYTGDDKLSVGATEAASQSISGYWSSLAVKIVSGAIDSLTVYAAPDDNGPFVPYNSTGQPAGGAAVPVVMTGLTINEWCEVPVSVFPAGAIKFVGDVAGEVEIMGRK